MISADQALDLLRRSLMPRRRAVEACAIESSLGRILAIDIEADRDVPPFRRSTMDGFAMLEADATIGNSVNVITRVTAGEDTQASISHGQAVRVMTGAPVASDAEVVIPFEWTNAGSGAGAIGDAVVIERRPRQGNNIVEQGSYHREGAPIVASGTRIHAAHVGAFAAVGRATVQVIVPPTVAVLPTGNELVAIDAPLTPGKIRNSNAYALAAQVQREGGHVLRMEPAGDDINALAASIGRGLESNVLVLSGGVSKGDLDLVPGALAKAGARCLFHGWAVQPGGPLWCGVTDRGYVVGLPGNPAATFVGFELVVVPILRYLLGHDFEARKTIRCTHSMPDMRTYPRRRYRPVTLCPQKSGKMHAHSSMWHGSGDPMAFRNANGLAILYEDRTVDDHVDVIPLAHAHINDASIEDLS